MARKTLGSSLENLGKTRAPGVARAAGGVCAALRLADEARARYNPQSPALSPLPWILHPQYNPEPSTLDPRPWILNPQSETPQTQPSALDPQPWIVNLQSETPQTQPWARNSIPRLYAPGAMRKRNECLPSSLWWRTERWHTPRRCWRSSRPQGMIWIWSSGEVIHLEMHLRHFWIELALICGLHAREQVLRRLAGRATRGSRGRGGRTGRLWGGL